jgi:hypothetical protein
VPHPATRVALAYPIQEWAFRGRVCLDGPEDVRDDCLGSETTLHLWWLWIPIVLAVVAGYLALWRRARVRQTP